MHELSPYSSPTGDQYLLLYGANQIPYVSGKMEPSSRLKSDVYRYHISSKTWELLETSGAAHPPSGSAAVFCYAGKLYVFGGLLKLGVMNNTLSALDLTTLEWTRIQHSGQVPPPQAAGVGGVVDETFYTFFDNRVHALDLGTHTWARLRPHGKKPTKRDSSAGCLVGSKLFVHAGQSLQIRGTMLDDLWELDVMAPELEWKKVHTFGSCKPPPLEDHRMTSFGGSVVLFGGWNTFDTLSALYLLDLTDPAKPTWRLPRLLGDLPSKRLGFGFCSIGDVAFLHCGYHTYPTGEDYRHDFFRLSALSTDTKESKDPASSAQVDPTCVDYGQASLDFTREKPSITRLGPGVEFIANALYNVCGNRECGKVETSHRLFKKCAKCKQECYCSRECQVAHWKQHRRQCGTESRNHTVDAMSGTIKLLDQFWVDKSLGPEAFA